MKTPAQVRFLIVALASAIGVQAQSVEPPTPATVALPFARTELTLVINSDGSSFAPVARVTLTIGDMVLITSPNFGGRPVQWQKDGQAIAGATANLLVIRNVRPPDAGFYRLSVVGPPLSTNTSQGLELGIGSTTRLLNVSTRGIVAAGAGQSLTAGFVVFAAANRAKTIILRAVGPSLGAFGVASPLRAPVLRVVDSKGKPYPALDAYSDNGDSPIFYQPDLADALASCGAFPIPPGTLDVVLRLPFKAGAYAAQVTSADNTAGEVLLEIYEVP